MQPTWRATNCLELLASTLFAKSVLSRCAARQFLPFSHQVLASLHPQAIALRNKGVARRSTRIAHGNSRFVWHCGAAIVVELSPWLNRFRRRLPAGRRKRRAVWLRFFPYFALAFCSLVPTRLAFQDTPEYLALSVVL